MLVFKSSIGVVFVAVIFSLSPCTIARDYLAQFPQTRNRPGQWPQTQRESIQVCILGAVAQPGIYEQRDIDGPGLTINRALELCGGYTAYSDLRRIRVGRIDSEESYELDLTKPPPKNGSLAKRILLSGDVLFVPTRNSANAIRWSGLNEPGRVAVLGCVGGSGFVKCEAHETLRSVIKKAGGFKYDHLINEVVVMHIEKDRNHLVKSMYGAHATLSSGLHLHPGDVVFISGCPVIHQHADVLPFF